MCANNKSMRTSCDNLGLDKYLYIGAKGDKVKIGTSVTPLDRMRAVGVVPILVIHGSFAAEKALHAEFPDDRLDGEWFRMSASIMQFVSLEKDSRICFSCERGMTGGGTLSDALNATTRAMILDGIAATGNNNSQIARNLGISRSCLISTRKRLGM